MQSNKERLRTERRSPGRRTRQGLARLEGQGLEMSMVSESDGGVRRAPSGGLEIAAPLFLIAVYQRVISPALHVVAGSAFGCRFHPTCSCYAAEALRAHGLLRGLALAAWRLLRCSPLSAGGLDPVPPPAPRRRLRCERVA
ncbi:putative membrane protein insertion efficiency factor [Ereboglobus sp. PH5-10]|nr:membrane protein insertion efficiency factor YidD [Ereboglobus sp. PH5-10]MDF9826718.1 putative membrane protein insertion efficiency factor [Ereboglobus sp. PH5-10]